MTEYFDLEFHEDYFHIKAGRINKTNSKITQLWETLAEACKRHNCYRVLTEVEIFSDEMTYSEAYFVSSLIAATVPTVKIACVAGGCGSKELTDFVELVASNRGVRIGFFSNRNEAMAWLDGSKRCLRKTR